MQALVVCWMELRLVADIVMIEVGPLFGRRGGGSIGWSVAKTRQEDFFFICL